MDNAKIQISKSNSYGRDYLQTDSVRSVPGDG